MNKIKLWLRELRAPFFTASVVPVLVGTSLAFAVEGVFLWHLFILAVFAMVFLHAGANIANDYFDHTSGNDWVNKNVTPFSGGSQLIQQKLLSPREVITGSLLCLTIGIAIGLVIYWLTKSNFVLILGIIGAVGGYFYTAWPLRLSYRGAGEIVIAFLFGILPVYGSYHIQTGKIGIIPLMPGLLTAVLIFLIIFVNEFPDAPADTAVNKRTLVVMLGTKKAVRIFRLSIILAYLICLTAAIIYPWMRIAALLFMLTLPLALTAWQKINTYLLTPTDLTANKLIILWHLTAGLLISIGLTIKGLQHLFN